MYGEVENTRELKEVSKVTWSCDGTITVEYVPEVGGAVGIASFEIDELRIREVCVKPQSYVEIKRGKEYSAFFIEFPEKATVRIIYGKKIAVVVPG